VTQEEEISRRDFIRKNFSAASVIRCASLQVLRSRLNIARIDRWDSNAPLCWSLIVSCGEHDREPINIRIRVSHFAREEKTRRIQHERFNSGFNKAIARFKICSAPRDVSFDRFVKIVQFAALDEKRNHVCEAADVSQLAIFHSLSLFYDPPLPFSLSLFLPLLPLLRSANLEKRDCGLKNFFL